MTPRTIKIYERQIGLIATGGVIQSRGIYSGSINRESMPESIRSLFDGYEEIVNNQMFSRLDAIEDRVAAVLGKVIFDDGFEAPIKAVQIFPRMGTISFEVDLILELSSPLN